MRKEMLRYLIGFELKSPGYLNNISFMSDQNFPKPIKIKIFYDKALQAITGKAEEEMLASEGVPFMFILSSIFVSYPEIEKKYPPGVLGFTVNGRPPEDFSILEDGDEIAFVVVENKGPFKIAEA